MDPEEISYKTLRRIQQLEKTQPLLTKIDSDFYKKLISYLKNLQQIVEKEENTQKRKLFTDEIQNTQKIATSIYELREKKIVQAALSTVRGGKPELKNLLTTEKQLYNALVDQIAISRKEILQEKKESPPEKKKTPKKEEPTIKPKNNNAIVRVTEDIPEFVGTDMKTYHLRKEDVLTLSQEMSEPLLKRGVAKQIK